MTKRIAVLVACYNRHQITIPNIANLIDALSNINIDFEIYLLDDASPDNTGQLVSDQFPSINVLRSEGNLFWNRGMHAIFRYSARDMPFDGYLLFNDDVEVDRVAVAGFIDEWRKLNSQEPTTLVGSTLASAGDRITYSGYLLLSRYRPFSNRMVLPAANSTLCDTFNGNFVLIPGRTLEELDGTDPYYWHSFGDIDLGLSIKARGERVMLAPMSIGRCDDRPPSAPSKHHIVTRLRKGLSGREDPRQHIHLILKHSPSRISGALMVAIMLFKRVWVLVANKGHVMPGSADAKK